MRRALAVIAILGASLLLMGAGGKERHHPTELPDPQAYNAHFPDMDASKDGLVDWAEFNKYFPQTEQQVFQALDLNQDNAIDHGEWHQFKEAHGMAHKKK